MTIYIADYLAYHAAPVQPDAAFKPSDDTAKLLEMMGAIRFPMQRFGEYNQSVINHIYNTLKQGDIVIQTSPTYTTDPRTPSDSEMELIYTAHQKRAKCIGIVHDIDAIRFGGVNKRLLENYIYKMNSYDMVIVQSPEMVKWLLQAGFKESSKLICLDGPWPYMSNAAYIEPRFRHHIVYGGNPDENKGGFMKKLSALTHIPAYNMEICANVGFEKWMPELTDDEMFLGFPNTEPNKLVGLLNSYGGFGLIMDGSEVSPNDRYFNYMKYVWPHKLSLYIAAGLPMVAIDGTLAAKYIKEYQLGIVVTNLDAVPHAIKRVDEVEYKIYSKNVRRIMMNIRFGTHIIDAVNGAINFL